MSQIAIKNLSFGNFLTNGHIGFVYITDTLYIFIEEKIITTGSKLSVLKIKQCLKKCLKKLKNVSCGIRASYTN